MDRSQLFKLLLLSFRINSLTLVFSVMNMRIIPQIRKAIIRFINLASFELPNLITRTTSVVRGPITGSFLGSGFIHKWTTHWRCYKTRQYKVLEILIKVMCMAHVQNRGRLL